MNECMSKVERRAIMGKRLMTVCAVALMMMAVMCVPALAADGDPANAILNGVTQGSKQIYETIQKVVVPVAAVVGAWGVFNMLFNGQKGMESGKRTVLVCAVVIAGVMFAPLLAETVSGWFSGIGTGSVFSPKTT